MTDLLIRKLPDALRRDIADRAKKSGRSLSDEAKDLLRKGLGAQKTAGSATEVSAFDALRSAFGDVLMRDHEHSDMMQAIEKLRREPGRPVTHLE